MTTTPNPQQPVNTPATPTNPTQTDVETPETPELDVTKLLVADEEGGVETPAQAPKKGEEEGEDEGEGAETAAPTEQEQEQPQTETPAETPAQAPQQPGTPDKVVQQLQQDLSATTRKLDAILAKVEGGQALTPKEQQQAQAAQRKLDAIREAIKAKGKEFDPLDHGADLAEALLETGDDVQTLRSELADTRRQVAEMRQEHAARAAADSWAQAQQVYKGVDVQAVWEKAKTDAMAMAGVADPSKLPPDSPVRGVIENLANNLFHQRADAASKGVAAKGPKPGEKPGKAPQQQQTTRNAPPVTPGGARVSQGTGVVSTGEPSEDSRYIADALALVVDEG